MTNTELQKLRKGLAYLSWDLQRMSRDGLEGYEILHQLKEKELRRRKNEQNKRKKDEHH